jgi:peptidoglycan/LPS O-acetylase OafA/YrhL
MSATAPPSAVHERPASADRTAVRTDIQGLRALAVSLVVVYHVFPHSFLSGGFVGVDVFFVISGFLITLHLMQKPPSRGRDLATFWGRRVRRLLPASLLVLTTTLVGSRLFAPDTQWGTTATQARGAALYVVNWILAHDSVDYLAADNAPSPVQHFWSLSVEEQFYFVWPILILGMVVLARLRRLNQDLAVLAGLAVLVALSLGYSVYETATNPAAAYFVTPTRMWELGIGGLLAVVVAVRQRRGLPHLLPESARCVLAWVGLAAIAWTAVTYSGATPFPGWRALLPVVATAVVIGAAAPDHRLSPGPLMALRPAQWLGDVSYSVYLWHWPLIVLIPLARNHHADTFDRVLTLVLTLVLAGLTKTYVEDRFRAPGWGIPLKKPFLLGAAGMAVVIVLAGLQLHEVGDRAADAKAQLAKAVSDAGPCFGAAALDRKASSCPKVPFSKVVPAPTDAANDKSDAYADISGGKDCFSYLPHFRLVTCEFGDPHASVQVALVGNSHAGEWLPALQQVAARRHWHITTYLASQCAAAETLQQFQTRAMGEACLSWVGKAERAVVRQHPDAVLYTNRISVGAFGTSYDDSLPLYADGMTKVLEKWRAAHLSVLVLHDTPAPGVSIPDCVAAHTDDYASCDGTRKQWVAPEPAKDAVERVADPDIDFVDLTDHICRGETCAAVNGGVITYFDTSHLTATYARTLAPYLGPPLASRVAAGK